eukprot:jgi/Ulvmu1/9848/UM057_0001.1
MRTSDIGAREPVMAPAPAPGDREMPTVAIQETAERDLTVWFMLDRTGSMHQFGEACKQLLPEVLALISVLGAGRAQLRFISYGDYDTPDDVVSAPATGAAAHDALATLNITGGGDYPEAVKTALHSMLTDIETHRAADSADAMHVLFLFTDAPPHTSEDGPLGSTRGHIAAERAALGEEFSWRRLCARAASANVATVTFLPNHSLAACSLFYSLLGPLVPLTQAAAAQEISAAVVSVFLHMLGEPAEAVQLQRCPEAEPPLELRRWEKALRVMTRDYILPEPTLIEYDSARLTTEAPQVRAVLGGTLAQLPALLKADAALRAEAVAALETLATAERVRTLMVNAALGKVWRVVVAFRKHDVRVQALCDRFSCAVQGDPEMRRWVEATYNMQEEIDEILNSVNPAGPRLTADAATALSGAFPRPTLRDTLDLLRGGITADAAGGVLEFLRAVDINTTSATPYNNGTPVAMTTAEPHTWTPEDGVPVALPDAQLFSVLLHLLHPGTLASKRAAALVAVYAIVSGNEHLALRAEKWLASEKMRGRWTGADDPETNPEVFSVQFMHVVRRVRQLLTDEEASFFDRLWYLWRFRRTQLVPIRVRVCAPVQGAKPEIRADHRPECRKCRQPRPASLMLRATCVFCADVGVSEAKLPECAAGGQRRSHIVQCRVKSCRAFYAVERPERLACVPKCHYCRMKQPAPTITCSRCAARHICPDVGRMNAKTAAKWVCAPCEDAVVAGQESSAVQRDAPLGELMHENGELRGALEFGIPAAAIEGKLSTAFREQESAIVAQVPVAVVQGLTWHGAAVLNCAAATEQTRDVVRTADVATLCALCCCSRPLEAMGPACGACDTEICRDCSRRWYGVAPGTLPVSPAQLHCPFCKRAPRRRAEHCGRRNLPLAVRPDEGMVLGFCRQCRVIQGAVARECVREVPERQDWVCVDCEERVAAAAAAAAAAQHDQDATAAWELHEEERRLARGEVDGARRGRRMEQAREAIVSEFAREGLSLLPGMKECPGCGYGTMRSAGCWHMTCAVCEAHWCWVCAGEFTENTIYSHMEGVHGGIGI